MWGSCIVLRSGSTAALLCHISAAALVALPSVTATALAQTRLTVDAKMSLAWWQMSPHLNHLWATTCPSDPSWRPGENRSPGWHFSPRLKLPNTGYANVDDTVNVPLYPRDRVHAVCVEAVRGEIFLPDTVTWQGAKGEVFVLSDAIITGEAMRDVMMHQVMQSKQFPEIRFTLDSLAGGSTEQDLFVGQAYGILTVAAHDKPIVATVRAFRDAGGLRVLAKWRFPAYALLDELTPKLRHLGLGASTNLWHDFFMGADVVFRPETKAAN
jgi:hypothetical protein